MTLLTRRGALAGASAVALVPITANFAKAEAPPVGKQAPGFYRYRVGDIEVTVVTDGVVRGKLAENFVTNAKIEDVKAALAAAHMSTEIFNNTFTPVVLNIGGKLTLIDTGVGEAGFNGTKGTAGQFTNNLSAAGLKPDAIDTVIISHYHGDHMNGLLKVDGSLAYPNAEILVPAKEHAFWMDDGEMAKAPKGRMEELFKNNRRVFSGEVAKRLHTYEHDKEVKPGLTAVSTPGHTVGHTSFLLASGNGKVFIQSDVTHVPYLFARHPGWHAFYDQIPDMAEATRRKVYDMLAAEKMMVQGFHYPFPAHAYIEKSGEGYRETMVPWNAAI